MTLKPKIPICSLFIILPFIIGCATTFNAVTIMQVFVTKNRNRIVVVKGNQVKEWGIVVDMRTREVKAIEIGGNHETKNPRMARTPYN